MTDRNFKQEFIDACVDSGMDNDVAYDYADSLKPTGGENISMLQSAYLFATLENDRFDMDNWVAGGDYADDLYDDSANASKPLVTKENAVSCGTTFCLAGSVAAFNLGDREGMDTEGDIYKLETIKGTDYLSSYVDSSEARGRDLMNISYTQAGVLFYLPDDINIIKAALNYIAQRDLSVKALENA